MDDSIILDSDFSLLMENGKILNRVFKETIEYATAGKSLLSIDAFMGNRIVDAGARAASLNYKGYGDVPYLYSSCISVNDIVVHGVPTDYELKEGDIVTIDCAIERHGVYVDKAVCFGVGSISDKAKRINMSVECALEYGIKKAVLGNKIGDISHEIHKAIKGFGFECCYNFVGHGIGYKFHTEPEVPNIGFQGVGPRLIEGMCIAIEPIALENSSKDLELGDDGWTIRNVAGLASHCEDTVYISKNGPIIVTRQE